MNQFGLFSETTLSACFLLLWTVSYYYVLIKFPGGKEMEHKCLPPLQNYSLS